MSWLHRDRPDRKRWACTKDGDLWEHAQKMMQRKGPERIKTVKVKGHATEEMVEKGVVRRVDKKGNDKADEAAGRGSHGEQRRLHALTTLYAERHQAYRIFMGRVQKFLVHMQKAEKDVWKQKEQTADPNFDADKKRENLKRSEPSGLLNMRETKMKNRRGPARARIRDPTVKQEVK